MAPHKEFLNAGKTPGLQVWRVEKMELAPVSPLFHGEFFVGDSYILLHTKGNPSKLSYDIYVWLGDEASQDEKGAAVLFMMQLDDHLGGQPRQHKECQNSESKSFLALFKRGIKLRMGGVASGFNHVETNSVDVKRVLHVKGRQAIRATEVPMNWQYFNKGDCFIIDLGKVIYNWSGSECNPFERSKAIMVANDIRDNERRGRATVEFIQEGSEPEDVLEVLGAKPELPPATSDKPVEQTNMGKATLYLISDASGSIKTSVVAEENPFKQDMLLSNECFILDSPADQKLYVWKGKEASIAERHEALALADKFVKDKNYSPKTQIEILADSGESTLFKEFFSDWLDKDETTGLSVPYTIGSIAQVEQIPFDTSSLHTNKVMAAHYFMVDDGSGKTEIWRIEGGDKAPVDPNQYGQFYGGDCYLILYTYNTGGRKKYIIYIWQGQKCTQDELGASAILAVELDNSLAGEATQVRVTQGKEPPHFVSIFKDKSLVIHRGGTSREGGDSTPASTQLFHIRESATKATRAVEVEPIASSLNSNDVFVLISPDVVHVWRGKGATPEELSAAKLLGGTPTEVLENEEPDSFWEALGGKMDYQTSVALRDIFYVPRLFACSNKTGRLVVEEVPGEITQSDLAPDDVMILDTKDVLLVWIGKDAKVEEVEGASKIAEEYLKLDPSGRTGVPTYTMKQGEELPIFTGWFQAWDPALWDSGCYRY